MIKPTSLSFKSITYIVFIMYQSLKKKKKIISLYLLFQISLRNSYKKTCKAGWQYSQAIKASVFGVEKWKGGIGVVGT